VLALGVWLVGAPGEAAQFDCGAADVDCLIAAIHQANVNGEANTIQLAAGVYTLTGVDNDTDGPNGLPSVVGLLTIQGAGASSTTIQRDPSAPFFRILHVGATGVLTVSGVTLTGGVLSDAAGSARGAGVLALGSVTISDSTISHNGGSHPAASIFGGGIAGGTVVITRSTVTRNSAHAAGGGVFIEGSGTLVVTSSEISLNGGSLAGGGVWFNSSGDLTISDSRVTGNVAISTGSGGGLSIGASAATITRSTIADNRAGGGGGIVFGGAGHLTIAQSAIVRNSAISIAGVWSTGSVTMTASTVANNSTSGRDGVGIYAGGTAYPGGSATVTNSTILGNSVYGDIRLQNSIVAGCGGSIESLGHNLFGDPTGCGNLLASDLTGDPGTGSLIDPGSPGAARVPLLTGSQAIDAGDDAVCGKTDQQGLVRPIDGNGDGMRACDIGAVEFYPVVNDLVQLDSLRAVYSRPSQSEQSNPLTAGGTFAISAVFSDLAAHDICNVAFEVIELRGQAGGTPTIVTRDGGLIGGEGIIVPAALTGATAHLRSDSPERYDFIVGLSQKEPIAFLVNVVGDATSGSCGP
jgi:hypothetical protein